jgi:hypothetical protein
MAVATAQQALERYQRAMRSAETQQRYKEGVQNCQVNPMALAATPQALEDYQRACVDSVASGRRAASLMGSSVAVWKQNCTTIGASNLGTGATKATPKLAAVYQQLQNVWQQQAALKQEIPGADASAGRERMLRAFDLMVAFGGRSL